MKVTRTTRRVEHIFNQEKAVEKLGIDLPDGVDAEDVTFEYTKSPNGPWHNLRASYTFRDEVVEDAGATQ